MRYNADDLEALNERAQQEREEATLEHIARTTRRAMARAKRKGLKTDLQLERAGDDIAEEEAT